MGYTYGETVIVTASTLTVDDYGSSVEDWTDPATVITVTGVGIEPRPSAETFQNDRNAVIDGYTLYDPSNALAAAEPTHRIQVRGEVWSVNGPPAVWVNPFTGRQPGTVVQVGRIDG